MFWKEEKEDEKDVIGRKWTQRKHLLRSKSTHLERVRSKLVSGECKLLDQSSTGHRNLRREPSLNLHYSTNLLNIIPVLLLDALLICYLIVAIQLNWMVKDEFKKCSFWISSSMFLFLHNFSSFSIIEKCHGSDCTLKASFYRYFYLILVEYVSHQIIFLLKEYCWCQLDGQIFGIGSCQAEVEASS